MAQNPVVLGRRDIARLLGVSLSVLDRMRRSGLFPVEPLPWPGHPRWSRQAVLAWLGVHPDAADEECTLLTLTEVAEVLNVSRSTAYRHSNELASRVPAVSLPGEVRFSLFAVRQILAA